jgi:hypothetical protein
MIKRNRGTLIETDKISKTDRHKDRKFSDLVILPEGPVDWFIPVLSYPRRTGGECSRKVPN